MNIQGIFKVEFYKTASVNLPVLFPHTTIEIDNYSDDAAQKFNFIPGSCSMKTSEKEKAAGNLTKIEVTGIIPGNSPDDIETLDFHTRIPHVYVLTDNTGQRLILGSQNNQCCTLSYNIKNDSNGKGSRSIAVKLSLQTHLFPIYAPSYAQVSNNQGNDPIT